MAGCSVESGPPPSPTQRSTIENSALPSTGLFLDAESPDSPPSAAYVVRSRVVKINMPALLDEKGGARSLTGDTITLNLFPDVTYTGVIDRIEENGDSYTWLGHLKDVEYSELTMIFTGEVFIAKIASPQGVYEVSNIGEDLYRIILIDQLKLPGGEDAVDMNSGNP